MKNVQEKNKITNKCCAKCWSMDNLWKLKCFISFSNKMDFVTLNSIVCTLKPLFFKII